MKKHFLIIGILVVALVIWLIFKMRSIPPQAVGTSGANNYSGNGAPNNTYYDGYPFINQGDPRADYANQPWSNVTRPPLTTPNLDVNLSNLNLATSYVKVGSELLGAVGDIRDAWNSFFD